jgi:hypothetical protein
MQAVHPQNWTNSYLKQPVFKLRILPRNRIFRDFGEIASPALFQHINAHRLSEEVITHPAESAQPLSLYVVVQRACVITLGLSHA